jgi:Family of unknown function (DUF6011)
MAQVKCGNCSTFGQNAYHGSVAEVRTCYVNRQQAIDAVEQDRQLEQYIAKNYGDNGQTVHHFDDVEQTDWESTLDRIQRRWTVNEGEAERSKTENRPSDIQRNGLIEFLAKIETDNRSNKQTARFAIESPEDNVLRFLIVEMIDDQESKWDGWTFVKVQASDDIHKLGHWRPGAKQTYKGKSHALVRALAAMPLDELHVAMLRYGLEIGSCGVCGRTLTDENSRAAGIGPICAAKMN